MSVDFYPLRVLLTTLADYRARTYDASIGRFLQRDPLGYEPHANLYAYADSNPAGLVDPSGLDSTVEPKTKKPPPAWPPKDIPDPKRDPTKKPTPKPQPKGEGGRGFRGKGPGMLLRIFGALFAMSSEVGRGSEWLGQCSCILKMIALRADGKGYVHRLIAVQGVGCDNDAECLQICTRLAAERTKRRNAKPKRLRRMGLKKVLYVVHLYACFPG